MKIRPRLLGLASLALAGPALAQPADPVATRIVADSDAARALGTIVTRSGTVTDIDGGTLAGANLFHSFTFFDLAQGETARWSRAAGDGAAIANVISRVTGGEASLIHGTLDSTALPNAGFWFINPAGILLGEGARVDVPAAAHFSTGQALRFADGGLFTVATPGGSTFSMAAPTAFGFVGGAGDIRIENVQGGLVAGGTRLTLAAANVDIADSRLATGGLQLLAAGEAPAEIALAAPAAETLSGRIAIDGSELASSADVVLAGGAVSVTGSTVSSSTSDDRPGGSIDIVAREVAVERGGLIISESLAPCGEAGCDPAGPAGAIRIRAGTLRLAASGDPRNPDPPTGLSSSSLGRGDAGEISLELDALEMDGAVSIVSDSFSRGDAGNILISAQVTELGNGARISSTTFGLGDGGEIRIGGGTLVVGSESLIQSGSGDPRSFAGPGGRGGLIDVVVDTLVVRDTGQIRASTFTDGGAGAISVVADAVSLERFGSLASDTIGGSGDAGAISVVARELSLIDGGAINSDAFGACIGPGCGTGGDAGRITIDADSVTIRSSEAGISAITSDTFGAGDAGDIEVRAGTLRITGVPTLVPDDGGAFISSQTQSDGDAGRIAIDAGRIEMDTGFIRSGTTAAGNGGEIIIRADTLRLDMLSDITTQAEFGSSGNAGSIDIIGRDVALQEFASISSAADGAGAAGRIAIGADSLLIGRRSSVTSSAGLDATAAGTIELTARTMRIADFAFVSSSSFGTAAGGNVLIRADNLEVDNFSQIISSAFGLGNGGEVVIEAGSALFSMGADIASRSEEGGSGNAGTVRVAADTLTLTTAGGISSSTIGAGEAGAVLVEAGTLLVDNGTITSESGPNSTGASGAIVIAADRIDVIGGGSISTTAENRAPAGAIAIEADAIGLDGPGSRIASANLSDRSGDAGSVSLAVNDLVVANGAEISTSSVAGAAGDIQIAMPDSGLLRLEGAERPGTITTSSGPGTGGRIFIAAPLAIVSNGGSILALGEQGGANVQIQTDFFISSADRPNRVAVDGSFLLEAQVGDPSSGAVERDLAPIDASGVLRGQCAAVRAGGQVSQLVVRPVGPYGGSGDAALPAPAGTCG